MAQRPIAAAKEIKTLIDNSVSKVDDGSKLVAQAGATMDIKTALQKSAAASALGLHLIHA